MLKNDFLFSFFVGQNKLKRLSFATLFSGLPYIQVSGIA
jgi:hypothetical protein